jgi:hypothetical protein
MATSVAGSNTRCWVSLVEEANTKRVVPGDLFSQYVPLKLLIAAGKDYFSTKAVVIVYFSD